MLSRNVLPGLRQWFGVHFGSPPPCAGGFLRPPGDGSELDSVSLRGHDNNLIITCPPFAFSVLSTARSLTPGMSDQVWANFSRLALVGL